MLLIPFLTKFSISSGLIELDVYDQSSIEDYK